MLKITQVIRILANAKLVDPDIDEKLFANETSGPIRALAKRGLVDELKALLAVCAEIGLEYVDLADPDVQSKFELPQIAKNISEDVCWENHLLPLYEEGGRVVTAFANPFDYEARKLVEYILERQIKPVVVEELKLTKLQHQFIPRQHLKFDLTDPGNSAYVEVIGARSDEQNLENMHSDLPPIVKLVNKIIGDGVAAEASDIHFEPCATGIEVRFRVDGILQHMLDIPRRLQPLVISRLKILAGMDIAERRKPQDGRLRVVMSDLKLDLRVSSIPTAHGEKIVLRLLKTEGYELSFGVLGFPVEIEKSVKRALSQRGKMFLVTGPTGSGKTTTLYTSLQYLRDGTTSIQTVEDPIEFRIPGITQVQLNQAANVTFASALRSILRQDPDVIMVGEIRDSETADIALQAAQTGHLVLSTLHTNDAPSVVTRLANLGCKPHQIAASLSAVMAQRLVRKICPECKTLLDVDADQGHREFVRKLTIDPQMVYYGAGCVHCNGTGYKGRTGIVSFLDISDPVAEAIGRGASVVEITTLAQQEGFRTLSDAAIDLVKKGLTSIDEVKPYILLPALEEWQERQHSEISATISPSDFPLVVNPGVKAVKKDRILFVEDDENVRRVMSLFLKREMYDVVEACNGLDGLEKLYEGLPQLILLDLMMPEMDGREFIARTKAIPAAKDIPILVLTAVDTEKNEIDLLNLGAADFVSKTSSAAVIATRVRSALKKSASR